MQNIPLAGHSILVVEDEPLIALDLETSLRAAGARVVSASSLATALNQAECADWSGSIIDFRLGRDDGGALCRLFQSRGVPFLFYSGMRADEFSEWSDAPLVQKPANPQVVIAVLADLLAGDHHG